MKQENESKGDQVVAMLEMRPPRKRGLPVREGRPEDDVPAIPGVMIGWFAGFDGNGLPLVQVSAENDGAGIVARTVCALGPGDQGRQAVLNFENGDRHKPIILGLLQTPAPPTPAEPPVSITLDGEQLALTAKNEIVLRCGKASITLTRAGKVLIRGAYVLTRSSGVNRIKGGSVQIN